MTFQGLSVPACVLSFHGPRSYTGEDLVEWHLPGNPILARLLIRECLDRGGRLAEPGEFTARAYFNGKLGLNEAEGVAVSIAAASEAELQASRQLLAGELARRLRPTMEMIARTLALVETGIDFSDQDAGSSLPMKRPFRSASPWRHCRRSSREARI